MCGIVGIVKLNPLERVDEARLKRMRDVLFHRGPDDEGLWLEGPVGLGFRRLAIVDLAGGHQPMTNEDELSPFWEVPRGPATRGGRRGGTAMLRLKGLIVVSVLFPVALITALASAGPEEPGPRPIPELDRWKARMVTGARALCDYLAGQHGDDELLSQVYYDAQRVFLQIADYTGDSAWNTCAQRAEAVYRDRYVLPNKGGVPGYWNFTTGLRMDFQRTGDVTSKNAAITLSTKQYCADAAPIAWTASADLSREAAYCILSYINAQILGEAPRARRIAHVNQAYDHMNQWFVRFAWPGPWQQSPTETARLSPFMVGLTAHSLIRDWEQTGDTRLIPALRLAADWMWTNAWIPASEAMWYEYPRDSIPGNGAGDPAPDLNLLIVPIYAFLYKQTGETQFRDRGDALFAGGVKFAYLGGGKQFDQNYWWSFDYVRWGSEPGRADSSTPR